MSRDPLARAEQAFETARAATDFATSDEAYAEAETLAEQVDTTRGRVLALRARLARQLARKNSRAVDWHERAAARETFEEAVDQARALADELKTPDALALAAWASLERALEEHLEQYTDAETFSRWCRRAADAGEASGTTDGLEAAAEARWLLGTRLVDYDDTEVPTDRGRGGRELSEAVRLGRTAGTLAGLTHAAKAGILLADCKEEAGDKRAAAGLRTGVCRTRELALTALDDELTRFDRTLREELGDDPEAWCRKRGSQSATRD